MWVIVPPSRRTEPLRHRWHVGGYRCEGCGLYEWEERDGAHRPFSCNAYPYFTDAYLRAWARRPEQQGRSEDLAERVPFTRRPHQCCGSLGVCYCDVRRVVETIPRPLTGWRRDFIEHWLRKRRRGRG